jgi:hypothetical protein
MYNIDMKYDKEEQEILDAYEAGEIELTIPSKKEIEAIKAAAESTSKKDKRVILT